MARFSLAGKTANDDDLVCAPPVCDHPACRWLNVRFTLSFSGVEDLLAERGLDVYYETVRREVRAVVRWGASPQAPFADPPMASRRDWRQTIWLWRAVDDEGEVLDLLVQRRRDKAAAVKLMRKRLQFIFHSFSPLLHRGGSAISHQMEVSPLAAHSKASMLSEKWKAPVITGFQVHFAGRYQLKRALIDIGVAKRRLNSDFLGYRREKDPTLSARNRNRDGEHRPGRRGYSHISKAYPLLRSPRRSAKDYHPQ